MKQPVCPFCRKAEIGVRELRIAVDEREVLEWDENGQPAVLGDVHGVEHEEAPRHTLPLDDFPWDGETPITARQILGLPLIHCMNCGVSYERAPREGEEFPEDYEWL